MISYFDMMREEPHRWQHWLVERLDELRRWFEGRLVLAPGPADDVIAAERFQDTEFLRQVLERAGGYGPGADANPQVPRDDDLRVRASQFSRLYSGAVTGSALIALAHGVGLDVSTAHCRIVLRNGKPASVLLDIADHDVVRCTERPSSLAGGGGAMVQSVPELRARVWAKLYGEHLAPLFVTVLDTVGVSPKLLWSNAAEWPGFLLDAAQEYLEPGAAQPIVDDCRALLAADELPGVAGGNPLREKLVWVPYDGDGEFPQEVQTRRMCCLVYYLADRYGRLCQNCPYLPVHDRVALIRERHGLPQSAPRGPAEQRAIESGLAKLTHTT